jgi:ribosomal protein S12 methylthiotransferase accessory factor
MEMTIDFPGGARVDAHFGSYIVTTDQPLHGGGQGLAPTPFATFLASIGTCAGI